MPKQAKTVKIRKHESKWIGTFLFVLLLFSLIMTGCAQNSSTAISGNWEKTVAPNQTSNLTGYVIADDGTMTLYTGYDQNLTITDYDWHIDKNNPTLLDIDSRTNQEEHQQAWFFIADECLYLCFDLKATRTDVMSAENQYVKTDRFSFSDLIPAAELAKDKAAKDAAINCTLTPEAIILKLKDRGLPVGTVLVYSSDTGEEHLLSQPNMHLAKAARFEDTTVSQDPDATEPIGGSVEVFTNYTLAKQRYDYLSVFDEEAGYTYHSGNVLVRVDHAVTSNQAVQYEQALYEIVQ
ncbi:MAG: hypothetical protein HY818_07490 [Acetobacterium woodii]|nr:hypothetical protein [Acetobacterium woodii]